MNTEALLRELTGLRSLARSLVHGDADADDLIQDAAIATIEHPPVESVDRPIRPWLAVVLRNRLRMTRRGDARRRARDLAIAAVDEPVAEAPDTALDRARVLEQLATALVGLAEPFRTTIVQRYLDGRSAADIARADGVPAGTVRWRIKTGLERLRAALDTNPRWRAVLAPLAVQGAIVKSKVSVAVALVAILLLLGIGALVLRDRDRGEQAAAPAPTSGSQAPVVVGRTAAVPVPAPQPVRDPLPGQGRATLEAVDLAGGGVSGRVINWSTGDGVGGAELTFTGQGGATTVRSRADGVFELAPPAPGRFTLVAIGAPGFLPFAPELLHSSVHLETTRERSVRGITIFLFPAIDYRGRVVDKAGAPVAGARVRLLGTPVNEQAIDKLDTEWTTDKAGEFAFHAADDAVFEAVKGGARGWARLDGEVAITHRLVITVETAAARDATISGRVVDAAGRPLAEVLVRAVPDDPRGALSEPVRATAFATTTADGAFVLADLDRGSYDLAAQREGSAPAGRSAVAGGTRGVELVLADGLPITGAVESGGGDPVPAYTLLVMRREGTVRELVLARSIVEPSGRFEVRVQPGDYELLAAASGWAPSAPVATTAGAKDVRIAVSVGATLRGTVVDGAGGGPLAHARVMREARGGGASAQPANAGTVTRGDGTFELTGIPPGPVSITIGAGGFHPKIEAGLVAADGAQLGPITIALTKLAEGEKPQTELVGIGVQLSGDGDALKVERVIEGGGAAAAGIVAGDRVVAVDGQPAVALGVDGAVAKIRGVVGTTVSITIVRDAKQMQLVVERRKLRA